ncbi:MAG TPA: hypothetical protein VGD08_13155 [Stellaceae bacterium]|jgi:hypothetical protein
MRYFPTVDLTPQVKLLLARGALRLQPGQWVKSAERGVGRYLRTDPRNGVSYVSWVRPEDDWATQAQRFHRACRKGFVGKYRRLYDVVKDERERTRRGETAVEGALAARDLDRVDAPAAV